MKEAKNRNNWILNCEPSRDTERDWKMQDAADAEALAVSAAIPEAKDLRENWWPANSQEATGSCVGWATADSVLRWHLVKAGRLREDKDELLSARFIWMASKETDIFVSRPTTFIERAGTSLKAALDVARKLGCVKDSVLPFQPAKLFPGKTGAFYFKAAAFRIHAYFNLGDNLDDWRIWLANNGPILTRLNVDDTWYEAFDNKGKLDVYQNPHPNGGHAVALVGFTKDGFIVRNSWGKEWGDNGFGYASNAYAKAAFTEAYGVVL